MKSIESGMAGNYLPNEEIVRDYLLGQLPPEASEKMEDWLFKNDDSSEIIAVVENDIIESYLNGDLNEKERFAAATHFFGSPIRTRKLILLYLLQQRFAVKPLQDQKSAPVKHLFTQIKTHGRLSSGIAAVTLLAVTSLVLLMNLQGRLSEEQQRSNVLRQRIQELSSQAAIISLPLFPGSLRAPNSAYPELKLEPSTQLIQFDLVLTANLQGPFRAVLQTNEGKEICSENGLRPVPPTAGHLKFRVSHLDLPSGEYQIIVSWGADRSEIYHFYIRT